MKLASPQPPTARPEATRAPITHPKRRRSQRNKATLKLTRRLHMYFGLVLVPFVLLYGVTAVLFNHQTWFSSSSYETVEAGRFAGLVALDPEEIADSITEELSESTGTALVREPDSGAEFRGDLIVDFTGDDARRRYRIAPETLSGTMQFTPQSGGEERGDPLELPKFTPTGAEAIEGIKQHLDREHEGSGGRIRSVPDLRFNVLGEDGGVVELSCDLRTGAVEQRRVEDPRIEFNLRSFLLRLHKSRGYPSEGGTRTYWAVIVDVTAGLMIFWALSGIIMWWQLRPTRFNGLIIIVIGLGLAAGLGYAMMQAIYY